MSTWLGASAHVIAIPTQPDEGRLRQAGTASWRRRLDEGATSTSTHAPIGVLPSCPGALAEQFICLFSNGQIPRPAAWSWSTTPGLPTDGEWYYLEANPSPGFTFYERPAGQGRQSVVALLGRDQVVALIEHVQQSEGRDHDHESDDGRHDQKQLD